MRRDRMRYGGEGVKEMNKPMLVSQLGDEQRKVLYNRSTWIRGRDHRYVVMVPRKARSK